MYFPLLANLEEAFDQNFSSFGELGASVAIWQNGRCLVSLAAGITNKVSNHPWDESTLVPIFSATKPAAALCVLFAVEEANISPDSSIRHFWPKFPAEATISQVLSHQIGLAGLDAKASIFDHEAVVEAIEKQTPAWLPPNHGYHPRVFGALCEEILRRLTQTTLGHFWEIKIRKPAKLDFWIGLPESEFHRVARLYPGKQVKIDPKDKFYQQFLNSESLVFKAFHSPQGLTAIHEMNTPLGWQSAIPSMAGIATANALAEFYQICLGNDPNQLISSQVRNWLSTRQIEGPDFILLRPTAFARGPMMNCADLTPQLFGFDSSGFGHAGAGGSLGFADPKTGISFAYVMNQMELSVLPGSKAQNLVRALRLSL